MDFLYIEWMQKPLWMWLLFFGIVMFLLALDLGVFHRKAHEASIKESVGMSVFYIGLGLLYGGWVWYNLGAVPAKEYWTGYIVEKTLAMDNVFVISLIFSYLSIPKIYQHRVLFWGIIGVILLRGLMIALGASLVSQFDWVLLIFAGFLLITGIKMLVIKENHIDIENNPVLKFLRKHFRITPQLYGQKFFVALPQGTRKVMWVTPLFVALILVEFADLIFAVDSVPAIFAITKDPFIVFTSNIFAILGLRALYFALAAMVDRFVYLKVALAWVLIFIGAKVFVTDWYLKPVLGMEKFPASISLTITLALLVWGVMYSLYRTRKELKIKS